MSSPGVTLTVRAYRERKEQEQALALAQRDYLVAQQGLEIAKQNLKDCLEEEEYLTQTLTDWEQAEVLQEILRSEK
ncbi:hypothetical protein ACOYR4_15535 [Acidovorax sp. M14]|uniref:hypothetical protein n=1 Tax=Acidovorax sp. M14 TaxID=3411354 RepID=UPI003BF530AC